MLTVCVGGTGRCCQLVLKNKDLTVNRHRPVAIALARS
jgi:hypothetical protein